MLRRSPGFPSWQSLSDLESAPTLRLQLGRRHPFRPYLSFPTKSDWSPSAAPHATNPGHAALLARFPRPQRGTLCETLFVSKITAQRSASAIVPSAPPAASSPPTTRRHRRASHSRPRLFAGRGHWAERASGRVISYRLWQGRFKGDPNHRENAAAEWRRAHDCGCCAGGILRHVCGLGHEFLGACFRWKTPLNPVGTNWRIAARAGSKPTRVSSPASPFARLSRNSPQSPAASKQSIRHQSRPRHSILAFVANALQQRRHATANSGNHARRGRLRLLIACANVGNLLWCAPSRDATK